MITLLLVLSCDNDSLEEANGGCNEGTYDTDNDGCYDYTVECKNNTRSKVTYHLVDICSLTRTFEITYDENGLPKTSISYESDGVSKIYEETYYASGNQKTGINYNNDGSISSVTCYSDMSGFFADPSTAEKHGCSQDINNAWTCQ